MSKLVVSAVGAEAAAEVLTAIHQGFGARQVLDPPSTALQETRASVAAALEEHGGVIARDADGALLGSLLFEPHDDVLGVQLGLRRVAVLPTVQGSG